MTTWRGPNDGGDDRLFVLIVEDDPETRHFYVDALQLQDFRTDEAHNGLQALEKAFASPPDVVVADIAVPGIDGIELCRRLRADVRTRQVPVLAVTGYEDRRYQDRVIEAGADRVLIKPCLPDTLVREIRELVSRRAELTDQNRTPTASRKVRPPVTPASGAGN